MAKYRVIARKVIEAEQFVAAQAPPAGVYLSGEVTVVKTTQGFEVPVHVGEWIVKESSGPGYYPIDDAEFRRTYENVPAN